jgi:hypothetical protein
MSDTIDTIEVRANVIMTTASLKAIVENMKKMAGQDEKGHVKVDTADAVNKMISRFLLERDFEAFARDENSYPPFG